jgi:hypothetical protein
LKTIISLVICILAASLGCSNATPSSSPGDVAGATPSARPAADVAHERRIVGDPRTGGPVFQGAATLPSPLKEVGR